MDPVRTAWVLVAARVHVAHACDARVVEALDRLRAVQPHQDIVVPGVAVRVEEEDRVGEVVVVVN